jgi:hypothetical protein
MTGREPVPHGTHHGPTSLQTHKRRPLKGLLRTGAPPVT